VWFIRNTERCKGAFIVPKASRTTRVNNPGGTVIINPPNESNAPTIETVPDKKTFWEAQEILNGPGYGGMVTKFVQPVTMEEIQETYGGYEYRISLHRGSKWICSEVFKIASPPKMMGVADPAVIAGMPSVNGGAGAAGDVAQVGQVLKFVNDRLDKERAEKASDPAYIASLDLVRESAKQAITAAYSANRNPAAENMQTQMMTMMFQNMSQLNSALMTRLLAPPEHAATSGISQLKEVLDVIPLLTGVKLPGGGGAARVDPWGMLISAAPQLLNAGATFMDKYLAIARERTKAVAIAHGQPVEGAPNPGNVVGTAPGGTPISVVPHLPPQAPQAPTAIHHAPQASAFQADPWTEAPQHQAPQQQPAAVPNGVPTSEWTKRKIVELIQRGMSGDAIMAFISGVDENFAITMKACSEEQIRMYFAADPILNLSMGLPMFDQTLSEAIEYLHPEGAQPAAQPV
jgi:hypothetical protein